MLTGEPPENSGGNWFLVIWTAIGLAAISFSLTSQPIGVVGVAQQLEQLRHRRHSRLRLWRSDRGYGSLVATPAAVSLGIGGQRPRLSECVKDEVQAGELA